MNTRFRFALVALVLVGFGAGARGALASGAPPPPSGFLEADLPLAADPADRSLLWWEREGFDWQRYDKLLIDPVTIAPHPEAHRRALASKRMPQFVDRCVAEIRQQLDGKIEIVDEPGPGVLRIRAAITDVETVSPVANVLSSLLLFVRVDLGGAAVEAEFLDGETGERVAAMRDSDSGSVINAFRGFRRYGDARAACRHWGRDLARAFAAHEEKRCATSTGSSSAPR